MIECTLCALVCFIFTLGQAISTESEADTVVIGKDPHSVNMPRFDVALKNFDGQHQVFDQHNYEKAVKTQAKMLVALEGMAKVLT